MSREDTIAIFPLPNVVFFPGTILPLHIFEPRYCEMVRETIETKQLIGIFLLQPGFQEDYYGNPPVFPVGCAGEMVQVESLPDGKYNILLRGMYRARVREEIQELPYRKARVEFLEELSSADASMSEDLREDLLKTYLRLAAHQEDPPVPVGDAVSLADAVNGIVMTIPMDVEARYRLLLEDDVYLRGIELRKILRNHAGMMAWSRRYGHLRPSDPSHN